MGCVGFEMASYGALIGAGKAKIICYVNGFLNLSRIVIVAVCFNGGIYNKKDILNTIFAILWVVGIKNDPPNITEKANFSNFYCIIFAVAGTCICKALMFSIILSYRYFSKLYFSDCKLIKDNESELISKDQSELINKHESALINKHESELINKDESELI